MGYSFIVDKFYRENFSRLREMCRNKNSMLIFMHNYPDPDSIGSAYILSVVIAMWKVRSKIVYGGQLSRPENIELVKRLKIDIFPYQSNEEKNYQLTALVDTQKGMQNNVFPADVEPDFVCDHHEVKIREKASANCLYHVDKHIGANVSILIRYYQYSQHLLGKQDIDEKIATLYCYALATETKELTIGATKEEIVFYKWAYYFANLKILSQIKNIKKPYSFLSIFSKAMQSYCIENNVLYTDLGEVDRYDCLPEIADFFISIANIHFVVVMGCFDNKYFASARSASGDVNLANILQISLKNNGQSGGHGGMAAAEFATKPTDFIPTFIKESQKFLKRLI